MKFRTILRLTITVVSLVVVLLVAPTIKEKVEESGIKYPQLKMEIVNVPKPAKEGSNFLLICGLGLSLLIAAKAVRF